MNNQDERAWQREFDKVERGQSQRLQALLADKPNEKPLKVTIIESPKTKTFNRNYATTLIYIIAAFIAIYFMFWG